MTDSLARSLQDCIDAINAVDARLFEEATKSQDARRALNTSMVRIELLERQQREAWDHWRAFFERPFLARLRWLMRGK